MEYKMLVRKRHNSPNFVAAAMKGARRISDESRTRRRQNSVNCVAKKCDFGKTRHNGGVVIEKSRLGMSSFVVQWTANPLILAEATVAPQLEVSARARVIPMDRPSN